MSTLPSPLGFSVLVHSSSFKFNLAHFVTYHTFRERLHGHNYTLSLELFGPSISSDGYVIDFGDVKKVCRSVCKEINEHVIIPEKSDCLDIRPLPSKPDHIILTCEDESIFVFPKDDCYFAPIAHSTVEEISLMLYGKILEGLGAKNLVKRGIEKIKISLSEAPGQESTVEIPVEEGFEREKWEETGFNGFLKREDVNIIFTGITCGRCRCECGEGREEGGGKKRKGG